MKSKSALVVITGVLFVGMAVAEENTSSWSVSAGVGVRRLGVDFKSAAPQTLDWGNQIMVNHNNGSIDLYKGDGVPVQYKNGTVGMVDFRDGTCTFIADSPAQVGVNPNASSMHRNPVREINFQSDRYNYSADVSQPGLDYSDDDTGAYPYLALRYKGPELMGGNIGFLCQYSFAQGDFSSGNRTTASVAVKQTHTQYNIAYDVDEFYVGGNDVAAQIPTANPVFGIDGVVWDATRNNTLRPGENAQAPRVTKVATVNDWARFNAITKSTLSVNLHELVLAPEWRQQASRVSWGLAVGPTVNLIDSDFDSMTQWVRQETGAVVAAGRTASQSDQKVRVGVMAGVSVACNIDSEGRYFVEAMGSYHWLDKVDVGQGADRAEFDASSADASVGFGIRL